MIEINQNDMMSRTILIDVLSGATSARSPSRTFVENPSEAQTQDGGLQHSKS
jgi:hypothetical protein